MGRTSGEACSELSLPCAAIGRRAILHLTVLCACILAGGLIGVAVKAMGEAAERRLVEGHLRIDKGLVQEVVDDIEPDD